MSALEERTFNREWIMKDLERDDPKTAAAVDQFGVDGMLDLLDLGAQSLWHVDLRRSPFRQNPELKQQVREVRAQLYALAQSAYAALWESYGRGEQEGSTKP